MQLIAKLLLTSIFCAAPALAGPLTFSFTSSLLNAQPGQILTFSANLTNTGPSLLFLNGDTVNVTAPLTVNDTRFFLNFPVSLSAGQSVTAPIFDVMVPASSPLGLYPGSFDVLGGATSNDFTPQATQSFAVNVVPEPGSATLLLLAGLLGAVLSARRSTYPHITSRTTVSRW